jgi:hypothetical protein
MGGTGGFELEDAASDGAAFGPIDSMDIPIHTLKNLA